MQARLGNLDLNRNLPEYTRRLFLSGPVVQPGLEMSPERTSALHAETLSRPHGREFESPPAHHSSLSQNEATSLRNRLRETVLERGLNELRSVQHSRSRQGKTGGSDRWHIRDCDDSFGLEP